MPSSLQKDTTPTLQLGEKAPDASVQLADSGEAVALSCFWTQRPTLFVFLRHFGCPFCVELVHQLRQAKDQFIGANVQVALITLGTPERTQNFCQQQRLDAPFICLSDPTREAYRAFALGRASLAQFTTSHVISSAFRAMLHKHFSLLPQGDPFQMPGVFLVDHQGTIRYAHYYNDIADNPTISELQEVIRQL
ncbi:Peroxiredoxin [Chthonomonas calidirosea]|uniref:Peroxiredoxin n=1 Tax=Chthonomonas calidirosea (strain DSM 23976 / ICMP 18418 / T49) TaxID=1303518 RepID=S0ESM4_CHTCT|nr:peroxiredoxin-like family protein [Chthonomonas calidirosea]CCW33910.1 Peroxiredoxin [Chthonomonas calidirosea T49]CEK15195.1 Peroxiredoxin [Chthonomonas calidirosea]CEK16307.1 Peroxiredoxin [Chthonomonas calidirosea]